MERQDAELHKAQRLFEIPCTSLVFAALC